MSKDLKYQTLVNVLDRICTEAPSENKTYYPKGGEIEKVDHARSRAFIHLYLKVTYGMLDFVERERFITDGSGDGGIDAYYIDTEAKRIDIVQSKFRTTAVNFEQKTITVDELLSMDVGPILEGETHNENGNSYNNKILRMQEKISAVPDLPKYSSRIVILANVKEYTRQKMMKLTGGFSFEVFDYEKTYNKLVFPVVSGTFYSQAELRIDLDVTNANTASARLGYSVNTEFKPCDITLVFVPTLEIGRILHHYKNSILKFNPRSYLELSNNQVNRAIERTVTLRTTNEFALFNNGITVLSDETHFNEQVGQKDKARAILTNPQVINGGQTAFTLSRIYQRMIAGEMPHDIFDGKEVLVKIITFDDQQATDPEGRLHLIQEISRATNAQTPVKPADERANDKIQVSVQHEIFQRYGRYYERKLGEFADGIKDRYIDRSMIVNRVDFIRVCNAANGLPSQARRSSEGALFSEEAFSAALNSTDELDRYFLGYLCLGELHDIEKSLRDESDQWGAAKYGQGIRYGKMAIVSVCATHWESVKLDDAAALVKSVLAKWLSFESHVRQLNRNSDYFITHIDAATGESVQELNFDGYYKGRTVNKDVAEFDFRLSQLATHQAQERTP